MKCTDVPTCSASADVPKSLASVSFISFWAESGGKESSDIDAKSNTLIFVLFLR